MNRTDDDLIAHLDEEVRLECEGRVHHLGHEGHVPEQPASYSVRFGCPQCDNPETILMCQGRLDWWKTEASSGSTVECERCGLVNELASYLQSVLPLAMVASKNQPETLGEQPRPPRNSGKFTHHDPAIPELPSGVTSRSGRLTWREAFAAFELFERAKNLSPRTIQNRSWTLNALAKATAKAPADVTITDLRDRLSRGIGAATMQSETSDYKAFFRFLTENNLREDDLGKLLPTVRAPKRLPRPYTPAQIESLLASGGYAHTRAMILLAFFQGFRASEVAAVHGNDVDLLENTIRVVGKGGKHSTLPLHPAVREIAMKMPADSWWFPARNGREGHIHSRSVSDLMKRAKLRAGINNPRLTGHSLRHSFGTELVRAGVDLRTVQELMRHETLQTTELYTEINEHQMREGLGRLADLSKLKRTGDDRPES